MPVGTEGDSAATVGDQLSADSSEPDAGDAPDFSARADVRLEADERRRQLETLLGELPERMRFVMAFRLDGETLADVGAAMGVSRERIRQLEGEAVELMQRAARRRGWVSRRAGAGGEASHSETA